MNAMEHHGGKVRPARLRVRSRLGHGLRTMAGIGVVALLVLGCSQRAKTVRHDAEPRPTEAWDSLNAPQVFGNLQSMPYEQLARDEYRQGVMATQPWSDIHWSWMRAGLAHRWLMPAQHIRINVNARNYERETQQRIAEFLSFARRASGATQWRLSPLEKYDLLTGQDFPLTRKELLAFARHQQYFESRNIPWEWMGSCDGWAHAVLQERAPRHPVLASAAGREPMLLTVGDVRGLVSKLYTDNHKTRSGRVIGTRCEQRPQDFVLDENNRIVDGVIGQWRSNALRDARNIEIVYNNWRITGHAELSSEENVIVFRYRDAPDTLHWLRAVDWVDPWREVMRVEVRPMVNGRLDPSVRAQRQDFQYFAACRDLNAGAFHLVLAQLLSRATEARAGGISGFVIEVEQANEVWNYPVYSYETRLGAPVDLEALGPGDPQDPYQSYRAPGTRYLVHAFTTVYFGLGNGPFVVYRQADEHMGRITYQYTLELDARGYVIGGEWHPAVEQTADRLTPLSGTELLRFLSRQIAAGAPKRAPDFLWRYPPDTRVLDTCDQPPCLSAGIVSQLAACSRQEPQQGDTVSIGGQTVPFVRCDISLR